MAQKWEARDGLSWAKAAKPGHHSCCRAHSWHCEWAWLSVNLCTGRSDRRNRWLVHQAELCAHTACAGGRKALRPIHITEESFEITGSGYWKCLLPTIQIYFSLWYSSWFLCVSEPLNQTVFLLFLVLLIFHVTCFPNVIIISLWLATLPVVFYITLADDA